MQQVEKIERQPRESSEEIPSRLLWFPWALIGAGQQLCRASGQMEEQNSIAFEYLLSYSTSPEVYLSIFHTAEQAASVP